MATIRKKECYVVKIVMIITHHVTWHNTSECTLSET